MSLGLEFKRLLGALALAGNVVLNPAAYAAPMGGLVASTLNMSDSCLTSAMRNYGSGAGAVVNRGTITAVSVSFDANQVLSMQVDANRVQLAIPVGATPTIAGDRPSARVWVQLTKGF
ncbi:MAG: hypothetical protein EPN46_04470 [Candidimonas sp.]|nr:MAG: hypothetical protein EPN77_13960 [Candidimonas sp.]TAM19786.1 MAG: hypothetical protein EPN62_17745 [Candidimonas sp.]TAM79003.1 MAG: hypothetical protein EPN46_04470 [Candidimonas sp.]